MSYVHTAPLPNTDYPDASDPAYDAVETIKKWLPGLVRNCSDQDALEAALRDLIVDYATGELTPDTVGTCDNEYTDEGRAV